MLVRFLSRGFHNGSIVEPGEVITVADDTFLGRHMAAVDGANPHLDGEQPGYATQFRADLAYSPDPDEVRAQLTEAMRQRAEATRNREAALERMRIAASLLPQPAVKPAGRAGTDPTDQGGVAADG